MYDAAVTLLITTLQSTQMLINLINTEVTLSAAVGASGATISRSRSMSGGESAYMHKSSSGLDTH